MKKKSFLTALLVCVAVLGAKAQNINGKVVDETNQSIPYTNVVQMNQDSAFLSGCVTDENGAFHSMHLATRWRLGWGGLFRLFVPLPQAKTE